MVNNLLINTVIPVIYTYGAYHGQARYIQKATEWMAAIAAEKNSITKGFEALGIANLSAIDSQAPIQLKNEYCNQKRCPVRYTLERRFNASFEMSTLCFSPSTQLSQRVLHVRIVSSK